jgi:hypothetical protein
MATDKPLHDQLNERAEAILAARDDYDVVDACREAAREAGLERIAGDDQCEVWTDFLARRVNLWIDAPAEGLRPGGIGFDDQYEWAGLVGDEAEDD